MAKVKGYTSYRGRGPLWKLVVTVLALSVILASFAVVLLQRNMAPNDDGVPQIQLPWQDGTDAGKDNPDAQTPPEGSDAASAPVSRLGFASAFFLRFLRAFFGFALRSGGG